jgi:hypothetical protein
VLVVVITGAALLVRRRRGSIPSDALALLALFALLHYGAYAGWLWTAGGGRVPALLLHAGVDARRVGRGRARGTRSREALRSRTTAAVFAVALLGVLGWHLCRETEAQIQALKSEEGSVADRHIYGWIKKNLPADAVLGARDAGKLGYFSGRRVVNLDGLANDRRFYDALAAHDEDAYIADSRIGYLLYDRPWLGGSTLPAPKRRSPDRLSWGRCWPVSRTGPARPSWRRGSRPRIGSFWRFAGADRGDRGVRRLSPGFARGRDP